MAGALDDGRTAVERGAWREAFEQLIAAEAASALDAEDLERLATAAVLVGEWAASESAWERAHQAWTEEEDVPRAARCAFWLAFRLMNSGDFPRGSGWVDRSQRQLEARGLDCVEQGYLRYCRGLRQVREAGDAEGALRSFTEASEIGARFDSIELVTLARVGQGRCVIYLGEVAAGVALLDEAIVSVRAREISPIAVGDILCTVIDGCHELFDIQRSAEWTAMLDEWCESQPDLVLYQGECLLHHAEVKHLRGRWPDALDEAKRMSEQLAGPAGPLITSQAEYLVGDLYRMAGALDAAEDAYRAASRLGYDPQPGLAQLRLVQGDVDAAHAAIGRALDEAGDSVTRARLLPPYVEIALAAGDVDRAREGADELANLADELGPPYLRACAAQTLGAVLVAESDARSALAPLRRAADAWRDLEVPYEQARARVLLAAACEAVGDHDGAQLELAGARSTFEALGAKTDLDHLAPAGTGDRLPQGLTPHEGDVLRLLATGETNAAIASELVISRRTVDSHVRSIFTKLGVSTRAAATAYAHKHRIV